jgi:hypothetical protein
MAADYVIIQRSGFGLGVPRTIRFNLFTGFHTGSRSILSFVLGSVKGEDTTLQLRVRINTRHLVYSYDSTHDIPGHWSVHQVISAGVLRDGQNSIQFSRLSGSEPLASILARVSNVVLWGHDSG